MGDVGKRKEARILQALGERVQAAAQHNARHRLVRADECAKHRLRFFQILNQGFLHTPTPCSPAQRRTVAPLQPPAYAP